MVYIQRKQGNRLDTVAEFKTRNEALGMLKEYQKAFPYDHYYISSRACKDWKGNQRLASGKR